MSMVNAERVSLTDRLMARTAAVASHLSVAVRPVGFMLLGADKRLARVPHSVIDPSRAHEDAWVRYPGDSNATRLPVPRLYRLVTRTQIRPDVFGDHYQSNPWMRPVIAWERGGAAVGAALSDEQADSILLDGYYDTLLGGGPNSTTAGLLEVATGQLRTVPGAAKRDLVMKLHAEYSEELPVYPEGGVIY